jgi:hypothetical protein
MKNYEDRPSDETRMLLLEYLEGTLDQGEKADVEQLLSVSEQAAQELGELKKMMATLDEKKEVFCPAAWKISEFVETGEDPEGVISQHLAECTSCSEDEKTLRAALRAHTMPPELWNRMKREFNAGVEAEASGRSAGLVRVVDYLRPYWGIRGLAVGTAAAILILALIYPLRSISTKVGLSSVVWNGNGNSLIGSVLSGPSKGKKSVAIILFFKDFSEPLSQSKIDSLYEGLRPKPAQRDHFTIVAPADLKKAITAAKVDPSDETQVLRAVHTGLGLKKVVIARLSPLGKGFRVTGELVDASTGKTVRRLTKEVRTPSELAPILRDTCYAVLGLDNGPSAITKP